VACRGVQAQSRVLVQGCHEEAVCTARSFCPYYPPSLLIPSRAASFAEDYNTATLPHPKFYNMASYERQMNSLRNGLTADVLHDKYDLSADLAVSLVSLRDARLTTPLS
jgi:hypothetical protein